MAIYRSHKLLLEPQESTNPSRLSGIQAVKPVALSWLKREKEKSATKHNVLAHTVNSEAEHGGVRACQWQSGVGRDGAVHGKGEGRLGLFTITPAAQKTLSAGMHVTGMHRQFQTKRNSFLCPDFSITIFRVVMSTSRKSVIE